MTRRISVFANNLQKASLPGNVLLKLDEGNLPKQSVIEVAKLNRVDKCQFGDFIGTLTEERVQEVIRGIRFIQNLSH